MQRIWFTSDTHFWHKRILDFCPDTRLGHTDVDAMSEALIWQWNDQVKKGDLVYHLGDFSFGSYEQTMDTLKRLKGSIHQIEGNHDSVLSRQEIRKRFSSFQTYKEVRIDNIKVCMFHFPMWEWHHCHKGSFHLFGHVHETYSTVRGRSLNVGIDARPNKDMRLWSWEEVKKALLDKEVITHHGKVDIQKEIQKSLDKQEEVC